MIELIRGNYSQHTQTPNGCSFCFDAVKNVHRTTKNDSRTTTAFFSCHIKKSSYRQNAHKFLFPKIYDEKCKLIGKTKSPLGE